MYPLTEREEHVAEAGAGNSQEQRKVVHTRLSEDQQVPAGLDNPFWKSERDQCA